MSASQRQMNEIAAKAGTTKPVQPRDVLGEASSGGAESASARQARALNMGGETARQYEADLAELRKLRREAKRRGIDLDTDR